MTNFEKYFDDLTTTSFGLLDGKPIACRIESCGKCDFNGMDSCDTSKMEWLKAEYGVPKINIPDNTPIDAKVLVSDTGEDWFKRHYAGCVDGFHYAWNEGRTSWSSNPSNKIAWEYMKLYE